MQTGKEITDKVREMLKEAEQLDPNQRKLHEATLLILSGVLDEQEALERRLTEAEEAVKQSQST